MGIIFTLNIFICDSYSRAALFPLTHDCCVDYSRMATIRSVVYIRGIMVFIILPNQTGSQI